MADADGNTFGPFDVTVPDSEAESFTEEAYYRIHDESGVVEGFGLTFTGLTAQLAPGFGWCHGAYLVRDTTWENASPATETADPRRDLLVLRRLLTVGEGEGAVPGRCIPLVLRGSPAAAPTTPDHDEDTDVRLWSWQVPGSGGTAITGITDHRTYVNRDGSPTSTAVPWGVIRGSGTQAINPAAFRTISLAGDGTVRDMARDGGALEVLRRGRYMVQGGVLYPTGEVAPGERYMAGWAVNGATYAASRNRCDPAANNELQLATASYPALLEVGDRLTLVTRQESPSAQDVNRSECFLSAFWIGD